jgi:hypothetical protein
MQRFPLDAAFPAECIITASWLLNTTRRQFVNLLRRVLSSTPDKQFANQLDRSQSVADW